MKETWTLAELAEETGLTARTIRYYIARGLLEGPAVAGRGAAYGAAHLARLREIQTLQSSGTMLAEIGRVLAGDRPALELPAPAVWRSYALDPDVVVMVKAEISPWRSRQIKGALEELAARLRAGKGDDHAE